MALPVCRSKVWGHSDCRSGGDYHRVPLHLPGKWRRDTTRELALASFSFMIPTLFFVLALLLLMYKFSFVASLVGAYLVWITGVLVLNQWYGELIGAFPH